MRRFLVPLAIVMLILPACPEEEEEVIEAEAPPPPTPQEIAQKFLTETGLGGPPPPPTAVLKPEGETAFLGKIRQVRSQNLATPEGKKALRIISGKVDERARQCEELELWDFVLLTTDAHEILNPDSTKFDRLRQRAIIELRKPKVTIKGIWNVHDQVVTQLLFYLPLTRETFDERMRIDEELHGLKLVSVVGREKGLTFEYLETGENFDVLTRAAR